MTEANYHDKYDEQRFKNIETLIEKGQEVNTEKLNLIYYQTKKTNGKVSDHEARLKVVEDRMITCPIEEVQRKQKEFEEETDTIRFFYRNPKLLKLTLIGSILVSVTAIALTVYNFI